MQLMTRDKSDIFSTGHETNFILEIVSQLDQRAEILEFLFCED